MSEADETDYLLKSQFNADRLQKSLAEAKEGNLVMSRHPGVEELLHFFAFAHLDEKKQAVSKIFYDAAVTLVNTIPHDSAELTMALRKLLEAKDCAVRASMLGD
jgi:ferritin-like protein